MILLKAATVALNVAFAGFITLLVTKAVSAWQNYTQRVENAIKQSQEAVQAADQLASSLKELENSYEELGDKSGWSSEDSDQAQDIQEQILELLKEQNGIAQDQIDQIDLQNGKYEDQLKLIRQIRLEQLRDEESDLIQNKDNQGKSLTKTAKKQANDVHSVDSYDSEMAQELADKFGWSYDADAGVLNFNNYDQNDPESVAKHYDELGQAIDIITKKYSDAERASSGLYDAFKNDRAGIKDQVEAYRDSSTAIDNNISKQKELETILALTTTNARAVRGAIGTLANSIQDFDANKLVDLLNGNGLDGLNDAQLAAIDKIKEFMTTKGFNTDQIQSFVNILSEVGFIVPQTADAVEQASQKIEDISSKIDEIQTAYKNATTAIEEYNKYGYLSADTLQTLLNEDFEYLSCLELVDGQLQVNTEKYQSMIAAQYQSAAMALVEKANAELAKIAQGEKKDAVEDATKATEDQATALTERVCPALGEFAKASMTAAAAQEFLANGDAAWSVDPERTKEVYAGLASGLDILDATVDQIMGNSDKFRQHMNGFDKETKNRNKNTAKSVTDVASAFDTLNKAMKEYNQYGYLCADTAKSLVSLDDKFTACLTKQGDKLQINVEQFRKFVKEQLKEANAAKDGGKSADEMNKILNYLDQNVDTTTISFEQLTDAIKGYGTAMDEAKEKTDAIKSAFSGLYNIQQKIKNSQFGVGDLDATESKIESILQLSKFFGDNKDLMDNLVDKNGNINLNTEAFKKATLDELDKRIKAANETGGAAATALANSLSSDKANIESGKISVSDYLVGLGTDLERVNTELDKYQTNWSTLKDAMDEWNTTGQLTQDTMQKLQELPEEFSNLLTYDEDGNAKIDVKELRQSYVDKLSAFAKEFEGSPIGIQVQAMIDDVREPTHEEYVKLAEKTATYQKVLAQYTKKMSAIDSNKDLSEDEALKQKAEVQKELDDALEKALLEVQETDAQVTTKLKKHWDGVEKVIEEFKSALSDAKAVLSSFLSILSTLNDKSNNDLKIWGDVMGKVIDKRIEALNKQKESLEENNEATERAIELSKAQDALARAQQQRTTRVYTENGYEWQANAEDVRTAREDLADKQRQWRKEDAEKAIDDQIKKYNEFKDKLSEVMDDIGKSWKDYQKELEYTAQIQKMSLSQMEGSLDGYHDKIIASLNTGSAITSIQNLITNLESLINTLTKVNNLYSAIKTGEYKDLGTKGLWDTIKGFFDKGKSENVNKSFKETFDAAKKAFNAGKKQLTDAATTGTNDVINAMINQIKTSGNGLVETFGGIWNTIKNGAQNLFRGSGEGGGIVSTVIDGFKTIGGAVKNSKIGSAIINGGGKILGGLGNVGSAIVGGGGKLLAGAGKLIGTAGSALAAAGPYAIPIAAAAGLGIYGGIKSVKHQKEIWSNKEDGFGKKLMKSVGTFLWDSSPIGMIVNLCKDISGKSKETAENTKDTANSSSETAENTKKATGITNLTINATQGTISEENKPEEKKQSAWDKFWGSKFWFWNWGKKASGDKKIKHTGPYNVDEAGPEMLVRQPASGRYTYLETGDGVVPTDITSRLFEMGGNPDKWFSDQLAKNSSASMVQSRSSGGISLSIGDVNVNNPVGDSDALARELVNRLPNKVVQELNRR